MVAEISGQRVIRWKWE